MFRNKTVQGWHSLTEINHTLPVNKHFNKSNKKFKSINLTSSDTDWEHSISGLWKYHVDLSDLVPFHSRQVGIFYLLVLGQV